MERKKHEERKPQTDERINEYKEGVQKPYMDKLQKETEKGRKRMKMKRRKREEPHCVGACWRENETLRADYDSTMNDFMKSAEQPYGDKRGRRKDGRMERRNDGR